MVDFIIIHFHSLVLADISLERSLVHFLYLFSLIHIFLPGGFFIIMSARGHFVLYCRCPQYLQGISYLLHKFFNTFQYPGKFPRCPSVCQGFFQKCATPVQIDQPRTLWDYLLHCVWFCFFDCNQVVDCHNNNSYFAFNQFNSP